MPSRLSQGASKKNVMVSDEIRKNVLHAIAHVRPYLLEDGGDITLVDISDDMVVSVKLHGACDGCKFSKMTMQHGVEETIIRHVPEIKRVVALDATSES